MKMHPLDWNRSPLDQLVQKPRKERGPSKEARATRRAQAEAKRRSEGDARRRSAAEANRIIARDHTFKPTRVDIRVLRAKLNMNQTQFARRFGFSVNTLRHWERGDRWPRGAAKVLLTLIERAPQATMRTLRRRPWEE
jgi:putative transcriptional regulator